MEIRLTQRDLDCFKEFLDLGCLTAKQLVNLSLFPNEKKTRDRLNLLHNNGYVSCCAKPYFGPGRPEYVYYLNEKKVNEILSFLGCSRGDAYISKPSAYSPFLLHHLAINDFIICLRHACKQSGIYEASIIPEYKKQSGRGKLKKSTSQSFIVRGIPTELIPDVVICLRRENDKTLLFVEVYRGTQTVEGGVRSIEHKVRAYSIYWEQALYKSFSSVFSYSFSGFRVLIIVSSTDYFEKLKQVCSRIEPESLFWLALEKDISPDNIFKPIWHVPGEDNLRAIVKQGV